eukprot:CAMPEP_0172763594 /NCGR_PEP_ID=MMETSP1074-20121228/175632_1 /TAXON_ID=2916 /ORGANISM="Ceratium fusus, Strain PA161109" /LENGTH=50 /DNA_ID=CAMNT_0013598211 /DNA_START=161 /DNA_END=313 /DNA_ORIENTATION=+
MKRIAETLIHEAKRRIMESVTMTHVDDAASFQTIASCNFETAKFSWLAAA